MVIIFFSCRKEITCKSLNSWKHYLICGKILTPVYCGIRFEFFISFFFSPSYRSLCWVFMHEFIFLDFWESGKQDMLRNRNQPCFKDYFILPWKFANSVLKLSDLIQLQYGVWKSGYKCDFRCDTKYITIFDLVQILGCWG